MYLHARVGEMAVQVSVGSFEFSLFVRGHHVYCNVWMPVIGEELTLKREPDNSVSKHAVAVTRDGQIVGHISEKIRDTESSLVLLFQPFREPGDEATYVHECLLKFSKNCNNTPNCHAHWL